MNSEVLVETIKKFSATIHSENEFKSKIESGKPLRVKYGIDPTAPDVHLGHTVPLRLLRAFQDLGHKAVIIIGDATAKVGDPSGRDNTRDLKSPDQIKKNSKKYLEQIGKIIRLEDAEIQLNDNWFEPINFEGILKLLSKFTVQQILARDDFSNRITSNTPIYSSSEPKAPTVKLLGRKASERSERDCDQAL
jgi:tyrosyl-tRNA synthetase